MRSGSPPILRIASARVMPFQTSSMSALVTSRRRRCGCRRGRGRRRTPSSCAQITISSGWRVRSAGGVERFDGAERAKRPEVAVEVPAVRHRVDVRAEEDRRQPTAPMPARRAKMLPAGSMRGSRPAAFISAMHEAAAGDVGIRVGDAADAVGERCRRQGARTCSASRSAARSRPASTRTAGPCPRSLSPRADAERRGREPAQKRAARGRVSHSCHGYSSSGAPPARTTSSCLMRSTLNFAALAMILSSASSKSNDVAFEKRV